ncbi:hypothetical protein OTU49_007809, partial [Cherax quadricarinatus]
SIFNFRRCNNRYSLHLEKTKKEAAEVQLKRASWSSFPLLRFAAFDDRGSSSQLTSKSLSTEDIKQQQQQQQHKHISTPKIGCSFLRGSTASFRHAFSSSSSSPSSRSTGSSGKSSITSILEGSVSESQYDSSSTVEDVPPYLPSHGWQHHHHLPNTPHPHTITTKSSSVPSLFHMHDDGEVHTSPKILYAHKKTPDVQRKSRKQLVQELEFVKKNGTLPEDLEIKPVIASEGKENIIPKVEPKQVVAGKPRSSFRFMQSYRLLGKHDKKTTPMEASKKTSPAGSVPRESYLASADARERICDSIQEHNHLTLVAPTSTTVNTRALTQHTTPPTYTLTDFINTELGGFYLNNEDLGFEVYNKDLDTTRSALDIYNTDFAVTDASLGVVNTQVNLRVADPYLGENDEVNSGVINTRYDVFSPVGDIVEARNSALIDTDVIGDRSRTLCVDGVITTSLREDQTLPDDNTTGIGQEFTNSENIATSTNITNPDEHNANFHVISDTIEEEAEDSECDLSEFLVHAEDSSCFERRLEDKLEALSEAGDSEMNYEARETMATSAAAAESGQDHSKKTELKLNLVKPQNKLIIQVCRSRVLRHISEEAESGASGGEEEVELKSPSRTSSTSTSASRTPTTPRSPAIDIDDVFQQKQREIMQGTDDMSRVRDLATRLKLSTRRPSYLEWMGMIKQRAEEMGEVLEVHTPRVLEEGQKEEELSPEKRKDNLQSAMIWLRKELLEMREQDQHLARQLMQLRIELQRVRLLRSCNHHQALVDEVTSEAEEVKTYETSDLCDLPADLRDTFSPVLRDIGVTRMNITSRRFSLR